MKRDEYQLDLFEIAPLPCPFCGLTPAISYNPIYDFTANECCAMRICLHGGDKKEKFLKLWNTRYEA